MQSNIEKLNEKLMSFSVKELLFWVWENVQPLAMTSSFQTQGMPLLHMVSQSIPNLPILFLDTGYHFPETLLFRDQIVERWELNLHIIKPSNRVKDQGSRSHKPLYISDPDACCYVNKTSPLQNTLANLSGWISGIRKDQTRSRANLDLLEKSPQGQIRVHPLANWTKRDIWQYINDHQLPEHPLLSQGYLSIGCKPCTHPVSGQETDDERSGRWVNNKKIECGLHTLLRAKSVEPPLD